MARYAREFMGAATDRAYGTYRTNGTRISRISPIRSHPCLRATRGLTWRVLVLSRALRHPHEVEQETGPKIQHAAPGVTNLAIACGGE
jgi:hypothetical protein